MLIIIIIINETVYIDQSQILHISANYKRPYSHNFKYFHAWERHAVSCMAIMHCYGHLCNQLVHLMHDYIIWHNTVLAIGWLPIWAISGKVIFLA